MSINNTLNPHELVSRTRELLKNRPEELTYKKISADTDITVAWLDYFANNPGSLANTSATRVATLYEYLSGTKLEVR